MNFDSLKGAWADDKAGDIPLPIRKVPLSETHSIVSKLRRNMKREFISQAIGFVFLILVALRSFKNTWSVFIVSIAIFLLLAQTMYYFSRFYLFYKAIGRYDLSLRKSIYHIAYELELNIEIYKGFNYSIWPLVVLIIIGSMSTSLLVILIGLGVAQIISFFLFKLYVRTRYGKQLAELKKIMEDLETEE
ncbi:hypothetical protein Q4E93_18755 [Flavitalea sp. BT771]|uniref:hypothetical protein n=1 Tax=Flavitalea sp. BT771 TaxID=3063329 RepID=UPI0026E2ED6F|nr:hypothetical protein [Flavitalea sp. BT771]MDO6432653.1 hypothetical protein [Flavitalea sp. BT771]MDV6222071.1 hypothetical protein [Flavitalea sp. BT771]